MKLCNCINVLLFSQGFAETRKSKCMCLLYNVYLIQSEFLQLESSVKDLKFSGLKFLLNLGGTCFLSFLFTFCYVLVVNK